jgi:hypothetical protein
MGKPCSAISADSILGLSSWQAYKFERLNIIKKLFGVTEKYDVVYSHKISQKWHQPIWHAGCTELIVSTFLILIRNQSLDVEKS